MGKTSNIKSHLEKEHKKNTGLMKWISACDNMNAATNKTLIDSETMKLVKYFIGSNTAAKEFDSPFFRDLFSDFKIKIPCSKTFSEVI